MTWWALESNLFGIDPFWRACCASQTIFARTILLPPRDCAVYNAAYDYIGDAVDALEDSLLKVLRTSKRRAKTEAEITDAVKKEVADVREHDWRQRVCSTRCLLLSSRIHYSPSDLPALVRKRRRESEWRTDPDRHVCTVPSQASCCCVGMDVWV